MTGPRGWRSPEHEAAEATASLERLRIALRLIAAARGGDFSEFDEGGEATVEVPFGEEGWRVRATLRADGVILDDSTGGARRSRTIRPEEMSAAELEERRRGEEAAEKRRGKPRFEGVGYRRTVAAPPQPGADRRVLAAEIYDDGFYVDFVYDVDVPTRERPEVAVPFSDPRPRLEVTDDLGTPYYEGERASFGGSNSISSFNFAPTPPAAATVLVVTTDAGTVKLDLRG